MWQEPRIALRSIRATRACLCRPSVNPSLPKYSTLPKFGNSVCVAHPGSSLRGDHVVVIFASRVAVDAAASGAGGEGRAGCPCEPSGFVSTSGAARFVSSASFRLRRQGWKNCGEMAGRAYGKTVWSWPSLLRSSPGGCGSRANRRPAGEFRGGDGGQNELGSGESTA